jgi:hypothetical protein
MAGTLKFSPRLVFCSGGAKSTQGMFLRKKSSAEPDDDLRGMFPPE